MADQTKTRTEQLLDATVRELAEIEEIIGRSPEGSAGICQNAGRMRIRGRLDGRDHFYNQQETDLACQLMYKAYLKERKRELVYRKRYLRAKLAYEQNGAGRVSQYLTAHPEEAVFLADYLTDASDIAADTDLSPAEHHWSCEDPSSAPHQENRVHPTPAGIRVRSKSEVLIASVLCERGLDFRYEEPLMIKGIEYYPDFTVYDRVSQHLIYYEHFGMMDDLDYERSAYNKISRYIKSGIVPGRNLAMTFETREYALTIPQIHAALDGVIG